MPRRSRRSWPRTACRRAEIDVVGFHGQTVLHRPERAADRAARRRRARWRAARHSGGLRFPRRRRRGRRAGRAARAGVPSRAGAHARAAAPGRACSMSAASPMSPSSTASAISIAFDTGPGNALIDDFLRLRTGADARRRAAASRRAGTVDEAAVERVLDASVLRAAAAEIARPQRLPPLGRRRSAARRQEHRGRRRDAHGDHRGGGRARRRAAAAAAARAGSSPAAARAIRP